MVKASSRLDRAAREFLRSGAAGANDPVALAEECNRIVRGETQHSIPKAIALGRDFVRHARRHPDMPLQMALRSLGWALHMGGKYRQAEKAYLEARSLARNDYVVRGRIDRILVDVYMYLGDFAEAHRRAQLSLRTFRRHGRDEDEAKTRCNYANLLHRQDRHREAGKQYRRAARYFEKHGGNIALAVCYYNEANTLVQLFDFKRAEKTYKQGEKIFRRLGLTLYVNECQYGLAWMMMLRGDYHPALEKLSECEEAYRAASQPKGEMLCQLDRAEAFLGLNLFAEARKAARSAERRARRLGIAYESAKAAFFYSIASKALGMEKEARAALDRSERGFRLENNQAFLSAVQLFSARMRRGGSIDPSGLAAIRRKFARAQLPLWEAICDLQLLSAWPGDRRVTQRLAGNPAVQTVPHLYSHWQTYLGDVAAEKGLATQAGRHWRRAADVLEAVRAKLPPVELRSTFMRRQSDPYLRLIEKNLREDPVRAAVWSERYKTAGVWTVSGEAFAESSARAEVVEGLTELAEQVTALSRRIAGQRGKRATAASQSEVALTQLQARVQHDLATLERLQMTGPNVLEELREKIRTVSRRHPVIQFHYDRDELVAFVHENGETRTRRYVDGVRQIRQHLGCWSILLSRSLLTKSRRRSEDISEERRLFADLGDWLWGPLEIGSRQERVLIIPEGRLVNLPWMAVIHDGLPLASRHDFAFSPSLRHHLYAGEQPVRSNRIDVFVGSREGLSNHDDECAALTGSRGYGVSIHVPCRRGDWPSSGSAYIWHYTGHARFRHDNPFYSSLELSDGPLFAADFRLKRTQVGLVTLAACRTGSQTVLPGEESTGLVRSLLEMGARNVVGSHWNVADRSTAVWMNKFYENILAGCRVGQAVRQAGLYTRETYPSAYDWAAFSVYGAG